MKLLPFFKKKSATATPNSFVIERALGRILYPFRNWTSMDVIRNYEQCAPLYAATEKVASSVGSLPIMLQDKRTKERVVEHKALATLRNPNMRFQKTTSEFFEYIARWQMLEGDSFILVRGSEGRPPVSLEVLNPGQVSVDTTLAMNDSRELRYLKNSREELFDWDENTGSFWARDGRRNRQIIHIMNFNAKYDDLVYTGTSEIEPLYFPILTWMAVANNGLHTIENGMRPSGAFTMKPVLGQPTNFSETQLAQLKQEISENWQGSANSGRPLFLNGMLEFIPLSMNVKDMDFPTLKEECKQNIYEGLGVPVQLVAADKTTAGNMTQIRAEFYVNRVIPFMQRLLDYYNLFILPRYPDGGKYEFVIDRMAVDVLVPTIKEYNQLIEGSTSLTLDEKRAMAWTKGPIKGGDVVTDPNGRHIAGPDAMLGATGSSNPEKPKEEKK